MINATCQQIHLLINNYERASSILCRKECQGISFVIKYDNPDIDISDKMRGNKVTRKHH